MSAHTHAHTRAQYLVQLLRLTEDEEHVVTGQVLEQRTAAAGLRGGRGGAPGHYSAGVTE